MAGEREEECSPGLCLLIALGISALCWIAILALVIIVFFWRH